MPETLTLGRPRFEQESNLLAKGTQEISRDEITVVIPALNEDKAISRVIEKTMKAGFPEILVVDGRSTDRTVELASQMAVRVVTQHGRGKTDAIDTAVALVKTPYMAMIDADDTYNPDDINMMLEHIGNADQVIGSRVLGELNNSNHQSRFLVRGHGFGNRLLNLTFNSLFGSHLTDVLSGIRLFRVESLKEIHFESVGFGTEAEVTAQYLMDGRKVVETPARLKERLGEPKLRYRDGFHILATILRLAYQYNPLIFFAPLGVIFMLPGLAFLGYVMYEARIAEVSTFHSGYALAGLGLFLTGLQVFSLGMVSLMMKRFELRQLRAIRRSPSKESR